ncbi:MAG: hypothetical protein K6G16_00290 [Lachnospiraceae bacterium]|nr:hypothetical protein [Lachnospiraceae bacterium]
MNEDQLKTVAKLASLFAAAALAACLWRTATKPVMIKGTVQAHEETRTSDESLEEIWDARVLTLVPAAGDGDDLIVPLPSGMRAEDVRTENHYLSRQLWVTLRSSRSPYDKDGSEIAVNTEKVREGVSVRSDRNAISLRFGLTGLYEPTVSLADGMLHVRLTAPGETGGHVVLVDPLPQDTETDAGQTGTGSEKADPALLTAQDLAARYEGDEHVHVYLTRLGEDWEEERARALLQETGADLCIRIASGETADGDGLFTLYNDTWYLRRYTNAEFARDLTAAVAAAAKLPIAGIEPDGDDSTLLHMCEVPAVTIYLPDGPEDQLSDIAAGLKNATEQAFEIMDSTGEER